MILSTMANKKACELAPPVKSIKSTSNAMAIKKSI